ncbi:hypothetical protein ABZZ74_54300 [Streptomyces sp. NPDC006476]|uniref:hypothetical protein n=1 Tax=Streptomyces sp. NPDC006476 TaxID=3157175 RepID=UPI0033A81955
MHLVDVLDPGAAQELSDVPQPVRPAEDLPSPRTRRPPSSTGGYTVTGAVALVPV